MTSAAAPPADCIISILGAPASGKGTLCKKVVNDSHFTAQHITLHHVSVGDLLRGMLSGPDINGHIARGTVLPGDELVPILAEHISQLLPEGREGDGRKVVLLDGFPRSLEQEEAARSILASGESRARGRGLFPDLAVYFECSKEVLRERYVTRKRGVDDGRLFEIRYQQHEKECPGVLERYREKGLLVEVDSGRDIDDSYRQFVYVLGGFLHR